MYGVVQPRPSDTVVLTPQMLEEENKTSVLIVTYSYFRPGKKLTVRPSFILND